jgi:hypothetical protein
MFYFNTHAIVMHYLNYAIFSLVHKAFDYLDIIMINGHKSACISTITV